MTNLGYDYHSLFDHYRGIHHRTAFLGKIELLRLKIAPAPSMRFLYLFQFTRRDQFLLRIIGSIVALDIRINLVPECWFPLLG